CPLRSSRISVATHYTRCPTTILAQDANSELQPNYEHQNDDLSMVGKISPNLGRQILENNNERNKHLKTIMTIIYPAIALFAFACFALAPQARAACQDTCFDFANTVQGDDALISNTTGHENTAIGANALLNNTEGAYNTAVGS